MSRTTALLFSFLAIAAGESLAAPVNSDPESSSIGSEIRYSVVNDDSAPELTLKFTVRLVGVFDEKTYDIPLRRISGHTRISVPFSIITSADGVTEGGGGIGHNFSVSATPGEGRMEVRIWASWTLPRQRGESELEFSLPYLEKATGGGGGFDYSCEWIATN